MKCRTILLTWGLALAATVRALAQEVVISEVMYRPLTSGPGLKEEWIELHNRGPAEVNLQGWRLAEGVEFTFTNETVLAAGGHLVVCADLETFRARHPGVANVVGNWSGFLNNNGEDIELVNAAGQSVARVEYATEGDWAIRRRGALDQYGYRGWRWFAEHDGNGKSLELINPALSAEEGQNWAASVPSGGTPGAQNSAASADVAPLIVDLQQFPLVPRSSEVMTITARFLDESGAGLTAQVWWRTGANLFAAVEMFDDGEHNEGAAGDGIYGAILPPQPNGTVVEFYVLARDSGGRSRTYPAPAIDEVGNFAQAANALYQVDDATYSGPQPFYRIIMTEAERLEFQNIARQSDAQMNMTFVTVDAIESQLRHRCGVRIRGAGSRGRTPPNYRVNIPNDRKWKQVDEINLNTQYTHAQLVGSAVAKKAGLPVADARVVQVRVNGANLASPVSPQFGSYVAVEVLNSDWAQNDFPLDPDGNIYRGSSGAHTADLNYLGTNAANYISAGYSKVSNSSENDWTDLVNLTRVLNTTPATQYVAAVREVVNVEEWMKYLAVLTLMEYSETALATGEGDDFSMYRGVHDPRFLLLAHDFDTIFGQGDSGGNIQEDLFLAADNDQPAMRNFLLHPEFVPLYYAELDRLLNTAFSAEEMFPLFDRLLKGLVPDGTINNMKTFATDRNAYVRSRIHANVTVTTNLPVVNGYLQAPGATVNLTGRAPVIETRSIAVNGNTANWDPVTGIWTANNVALNPGINRILIQARNAAGAAFQRTQVDVFYNAGRSNLLGGPIENSATWTAATGPYWINQSVIIESGVTITIEPGTTVYVDPGLSIEVFGSARLIAEGTAERRIRFTRPPGASGRWGEMYFNNNNAESRLVNVDFEHSGSTGRSIRANNAILYFDNLTFGNTAGSYCSLDNSSFVVRNSVFPTSSGVELFHGSGIRAGGYAIIESNLFGTTTGLNDIIDFTGGQRPGPILQVLNNVFTGASDDVLDLDGADAHVEGNVFMNVHQQTPGGDTASAVSGGADSGNTSEITIVRNFFFDCDHAVLAKEGNFYTIVNNTMLNMTRAAVNFDEPLRRAQGVTPGRGALLDGNIIWQTSSNFANVYVEDPTFGSTELQVQRSILSGPDFAVGPGNLSLDPRLVNTNRATITAATLRESLALMPGSPGIGAGLNGLDIGAAVPVGASISGEPPSATSSTSATLTVNGPGITHYRYSLDGAAYGTETPIATPITLAGLANGTHGVAVIGKNSAGVYQTTPTVSRAWTVQTGVGNVRLNEVLARNDSAFRVGSSYPDLIELFNSGDAIVNLTGMSVSDDLAQPKKFTFPAGASIAPGQHLVLYADNPNGPGLWLGFALDQRGDGVYLFNADGTLRDTVEFGLQIPNASVGRLADGGWALNRPTFGAANRQWLTGDPRRLKLNEWLALGRVAYENDFVEVYNANPEPTDLSGVFLTDAPQGAPFLHRLADLSFIAGFGFAVFHASGDTNAGPDHLNFRLAADQGELALTDVSGAVIDSIVYGPQAPDTSEGRRPNGAGTIAQISPPTPGSPNPGAAGTSTTTNITIGLLPMATTWRYNAAGQEPAGSWRDIDYDDSTWQTGSALLANENCNCLPQPGINTFLSLNGNTGSQITTYYFRKTFEVNTNTSGFRLVANLILDDGAVVYLNGSEVLRVRMPVGTIDYFSQANSTVNNASFETFDLSTASLLPRTNVLAIEVHQGGLPSSDVVFGLSLDASRTITNVNALPVGLNEVMANNGSFTNNGVVTDWAEIHNSGTNVVDLGGMSLSDDLNEPRRWVFPAGTILPPDGYLLVHCDGNAPASTNAFGAMNTGFGLSADGGNLSLFDAPERGGAQLSALAYGIQPVDFSLARFPAVFGAWALALPTPGGVNVAASLGSSANLRINEWLANPSGNDEDFLELYNPNAQPVDLSGLFLTDNLNSRTESRIADLSFIGFGENGFVRFIADGNIDSGADHVRFRLSASGEAIGVFNAAGMAVDTVTFGRQDNGISEGRFPDGSANTTRFPGTATPGSSNMRQLTEVVINEALTHTDPPVKDAVELFNPTAASVDISGWYLSDRRNDPKKFRIPSGTVIEAGGHVVFNEDDFNPVPGIYPSFALSSAEGEDLYLFTADEAGNLTGYRTGVEFGAAENGVPFGQYETSVGFEFPSLSQLTLGAGNAYPRVGPIVVNEIMYRPPDVGTNDNQIDEFIELLNITPGIIPLFDPAFPTNTWRLRDAVDFDFPQGISIPAGGTLLIVSFDPSTNVTALAGFRSRYGLSDSVPIFGPYDGRLANDGENVELYKPDAPEASGPNTGRVPYVEVDKVKYADNYPWPSAADGNTNGVGVSLQRRASNQFGNDPVNWLAGTPTPGALNGGAVDSLPVINVHPQSQTVAEGSNVSFSTTASGAGPLRYQWRVNGGNILGATNAALTLTNVQITSDGRYALLVVNAVGAVLSQSALLTVQAPPRIMKQPEHRSVQSGGTAVFSVTAQGSRPLMYQWKFNGRDLANETNAVLVVSDVQSDKEGDYSVTVSNAFGSITSDLANLSISALPFIITQPVGTNVFVGADVSFRVVATGSLPLRYQWRFNNTPLPGATNAVLTLVNVQLAHAGNYSVRITNNVGAVLSADAALVVNVPPQVSVVATDGAAAEAGSSPGAFSLVRSGSLAEPLTIQFSLNGSAIYGSDYDMPSSPVTIPAGSASVLLPVTPVNDSEREPTETVVLNLIPATEYGVSGSGSATVILSDDDNILPIVNITSPADGSRFALPTNVLIRATASDGDGPISKVEFYYGATNKIGEALMFPYEVGWSNPPAGGHLVTAVAFDEIGGSSVSAAVRLTFAAPGLADMFADRGVLGGYTNFITGANSAYTKEPGEPRHHHNGSGNGNKSAWLSWVAPVSGNVTMSTIGSSFDTILVVYTNNPPTVQDLSNLIKVASNDDMNNNSLQSQVIFPAVAGTAYQIAVDGYNSSASGTIVFRLGMPNPNPAIVTQPLNQFANPGANVTFSVTASSPTPLRYQWRFNGGDILNATNATLLLTNVQQVNVGYYNVLVQNAAGEVLSASASLTLRTPPTIVTPLADTVVNVGSNVVFSVSVSGSTPFTFQWRFNGVAIPGVPGGTLVRNNIQYTNGGVYSVTVSNGAGSTSSQAEVIVRPRLLSSSASTNGGFALRFLGTPGKAYNVLATTNLIDWQTAGTVTNQLVPAEYVDPGAHLNRIYRLQVAP